MSILIGKIQVSGNDGLEESDAAGIRPFAKSPFRNEKDWVFEQDAASREVFSNSGPREPIAALFFGCGCSSTPSSRLALGSRRLGLSEITFGKGLKGHVNLLIAERTYISAYGELSGAAPRSIRSSPATLPWSMRKSPMAPTRWASSSARTANHPTRWTITRAAVRSAISTSAARWRPRFKNSTSPCCHREKLWRGNPFAQTTTARKVLESIATDAAAGKDWKKLRRAIGSLDSFDTGSNGSDVHKRDNDLKILSLIELGEAAGAAGRSGSKGPEERAGKSEALTTYTHFTSACRPQLHA